MIIIYNTTIAYAQYLKECMEAHMYLAAGLRRAVVCKRQEAQKQKLSSQVQFKAVQLSYCVFVEGNIRRV